MLRTLQTERLRRVLCSERFEWKVLVLDRAGQDVIAPIFRLNDLRDMGVVLCLALDEERTPIREAKAVYLVEETAANVDAIKKDVSRRLYREYELNFTGSLKRKLFEDLAVGIGGAGQGRAVKAVRDMFISISVLQESLFTLNVKNSFKKTKEHQDRIVDGLVSLFTTLDDLPVVQGYRKDADALEVANAFAKRMASLGRTRQAQSPLKKRPLLIIVDRTFDIVRPVEHVWTYNALINDLLEFDLNKVTIPEQKRQSDPLENLGEGKTSVFDLSKADFFWEANQNEYFPTVAEKIEKELDTYKAELALRSIDAKSSREVIEQALSKVPELSVKNKVIYTHMAISLSIVEQIKKEFLDEFFSFEHEASSLGSIKEDLRELAEKATKENVLRMCIVLLHKYPGEKDKEFVMSLARSKNLPARTLEYFMGSDTQKDKSTMNSVVMSAAGSLLRNIKSILPSKTRLPITDLVEKALRKEANDLFTVDPRSDGHREVSGVVVFTLGGGTFTEFKALQGLGEDVGVEIVYGSTEMLSAEGFLAQLHK